MRSTILTVTAVCALISACDKPKISPAARPRIVTFAPHITDIAFDMGLGDHVVGVTSFCILPPGQERTVMGNAFTVNAEFILAEDPDILFYNQKDADFETLRQLKPSLKLVRMRNGTLAQLRAGIEAMGAAAGRKDLADAMLTKMDARFKEVEQAVAGRGRPRVLLILGTEHPSAVGTEWLTHELIETAGGINAAAEIGLKGWRTINWETVLSLQPDVLICQTDPGERNMREGRTYWSRFTDVRAVQNKRLYVTDDPRLTIPGSKVAQTARKLAEMIHPDAPSWQKGASQP